MKKLEELGISPVPWKIFRGGDLVGGHGFSLMDGDGYFLKTKDARMSSASPDMYEALRKITEEQECGQDCAKCKNHGCVIKECKSALAKASGEGATNGTKH